MTQQVRDFIKGAFVLIALFLVLAHAGGFATAIGSTTSGLANDFKVLQGR